MVRGRGGRGQEGEGRRETMLSGAVLSVAIEGKEYVDTYYSNPQDFNGGKARGSDP